MSCFYCKGEMKRQFVAHTVDLGKCVVVVRNVPAEICEHCGSTWYDGIVTQKLEMIVKMIEATAITEVAVVNYADKVA